LGSDCTNPRLQYHRRVISDVSRFTLPSAFSGWWRSEFQQHGFLATLRKLRMALWDFVQESMPAERKRRYGDADFDWDARVDTTSATVGWRDRLIGCLYSAYQPTQPDEFREMMLELPIRFEDFTFVDVGSGKGRVLLMAADYPFRRILGIELLPDLHQVAEGNIKKYKSTRQRCFTVESTCMDASRCQLPVEPLVIYLFHPLTEVALRQFMANLDASLAEHPRTIWVVYLNPILEYLLAQSPHLRRTGGTHQFSIYANV
jgi:hypothetical protein